MPNTASIRIDIAELPAVKTLVDVMGDELRDLYLMIGRVACPTGEFELPCGHGPCARYRNERASIVARARERLEAIDTSPVPVEVPRA